MSVEQLKAAVESASSEVRTAYVSFIVFALYFAVTVGATTHEELLRGSHVTMPALGVGLPIVGFYVLVPPLFLLFHAVLLIQLNVLAARARRLHEAGTTAEESFGPPFVLSQFLLGGIRGTLLRPLVGGAMGVSLILLPLGLLLFVQVRFLPYHSEWVTWWHRILVVLDLGLVWLLWPQILKAPAGAPVAAGDQRPRWSTRSRQRLSARAAAGLALLARAGLTHHLGLVALTVGIVGFSWGLATIPATPAEPLRAADAETVCAASPTGDRQADAPAPRLAYDVCGWSPLSYLASVSLAPSVQDGPSRTVSCLSYLLFEAPTTPLNMRRNLRLRSADLVAGPPPDVLIEQLGLDKAWEEHSRGLDLRGRDLRYADLSGSDLRKADLRGADLLGATLAFADLRYVKAGDVPLSEFDGCRGGLRDAAVCRSRMRSANLENANLQFARLHNGDLRQADLDYASLQNSDLGSAQLCDASLRDASLQGAVLHSSQLDRAVLDGARLGGANLSNASLRGAQLARADLAFAHLKGAQLARADLSEARLDGAFLPQADLTGANLARAYLAGANLRGATLEGVMLGDADGEAFLGWSDLREIDPETLKTVFDSAHHAIRPEVLPGADPVRYERNLAALLAGKACRPEVSPAIVQSLVSRMIDDIHLNKVHRPHHQKVAQRLLAQLAPDAPALGGAPGADRLAAGAVASCRPALAIPPHMQNNLRAIMVLLLDVD